MAKVKLTESQLARLKDSVLKKEMEKSVPSKSTPIKLSESQLKQLITNVVEKEKSKNSITLTSEEEKQMVKESFNLITENTYYGEENINELFDVLHEKTVELQEKGVSDEAIDEGLMDLIGGGLSRIFSGGGQALAEKALGWLFDKLPLISSLPKGIKDMMIIGLPNLFKKHGTSSFSILMNPAKNCEKFADWLVDTIREYLLNTGLPKLGLESGTMRNMIDDIINDGFQGGQDEMNASICEKIKAFFSGDDVLEKSKDSGDDEMGDAVKSGLSKLGDVGKNLAKGLTSKDPGNDSMMAMAPIIQQM